MAIDPQDAPVIEDTKIIDDGGGSGGSGGSGDKQTGTVKFNYLKASDTSSGESEDETTLFADGNEIWSDDIPEGEQVKLNTDITLYSSDDYVQVSASEWDFLGGSDSLGAAKISIEDEGLGFGKEVTLEGHGAEYHVGFDIV